jgi:hypothetical protein
LIYVPQLVVVVYLHRSRGYLLQIDIAAAADYVDILKRLSHLYRAMVKTDVSLCEIPNLMKLILGIQCFL